MFYTKTHLSFQDQLQTFISRGMRVYNPKMALIKLENISYYKIKEFSLPYMNHDGNYKDDTSFERVIKNFYQDKNIRMYFLEAIEKVELSFKTKFAYLLGKKYSAFGYLNFSNWCDRSIPRHEILKRENKFLTKTNSKISEIKKSINKDIYENPIVKKYFQDYPSENRLPIWMLTEILTFGEVMYLYDTMSLKNRKIIAHYYDLTLDEFTSWIKNLKLVRNLCAHNTHIINIKFKAVPLIKNEWKTYMFQDKGSKLYTNRIANTIMILNYLVAKINPDFKFGNIHKTMCKLIRDSDEDARFYGFDNKRSIDFLFKK